MEEQNDKHSEIYYKLGAMHGDIKSTLAEAKRTNGRVTKLELETNKLKLKIAYYTGGFAVVMWILEKAVSKLGL